MKESESEYELVFDNVSDGLLLLDINQKVKKVNDQFLEISGLKSKEVIGKIISNVIPGFRLTNEMIISSYNKKRFGALLKEMEYQVGNRYLLAKASFVKNEVGLNGFLVMVNDLTRFKESERVKADVEAQKQMIKIRKEYTMMITHDLKQPLTPIMGYADLVKSQLTNKKQVEQLDLIILNSKMMLDLINRILTLYKLESGIFEYKHELNDLNKIIDEAINEKEMALNLKKIKIIKKLSTIKLKCDKSMIREVITNLLDNAIKFTKNKGKIQITSWKTSKDVNISIKDNGIGIKKADLGHLFEEFHQTIEGKKKGGTGIGLTIVNNIIKDHNGKLDVKSKYGKGCEFIINLPI